MAHGHSYITIPSGTRGKEHSLLNDIFAAVLAIYGGGAAGATEGAAAGGAEVAATAATAAETAATAAAAAGLGASVAGAATTGAEAGLGAGALGSELTAVAPAIAPTATTGALGSELAAVAPAVAPTVTTGAGLDAAVAGATAVPAAKTGWLEGVGKKVGQKFVENVASQALAGPAVYPGGNPPPSQKFQWGPGNPMFDIATRYQYKPQDYMKQILEGMWR